MMSRTNFTPIIFPGKSVFYLFLFLDVYTINSCLYVYFYALKFPIFITKLHNFSFVEFLRFWIRFAKVSLLLLIILYIL